MTSQIPKPKALCVLSPDKSIFLNWIWEGWIVKWYLGSFKTNGIRISSGFAYKQFRNSPLLQRRTTETLNQTKLFWHCSRKSPSLVHAAFVAVSWALPFHLAWHSFLNILCLGKGGCVVFSSWLFNLNSSPLAHPQWLSLNNLLEVWETVRAHLPPASKDCLSHSLKHGLAILLLVGQHTFKMSCSCEKYLHTDYFGENMKFSINW